MMAKFGPFLSAAKRNACKKARLICSCRFSDGDSSIRQ